MALAFDVYGTLVDTSGIASALKETAGDEAGAIAARWRDKQLEYAFRRALMRRYVSFSECTRQALDFVLEERNISADESTRKGLMEAYGRLPSFPDAKECLEELSAKSKQQCFAFSNGEDMAVRKVLQNCGLFDYFEGIVSVEEMELYKPSPEVYEYFIQRTESESAWLVSSNPFDIIGARAAGWKAAWINRGSIIYDKWPEEEFKPTLILDSLARLPGELS